MVMTHENNTTMYISNIVIDDSNICIHLIYSYFCLRRDDSACSIEKEPLLLTLIALVATWLSGSLSLKLWKRPGFIYRLASCKIKYVYIYIYLGLFNFSDWISIYSKPSLRDDLSIFREIRYITAQGI